jgi:hypothetical protein
MCGRDMGSEPIQGPEWPLLPPNEGLKPLFLLGQPVFGTTEVVP